MGKKLLTVNEKVFARLLGSSGWFPFFRGLDFLPMREALMLQDLFNKLNLEVTRVDSDGYFLCTTKYLEHSLKYWVPDTQRRALEHLKRKGYVKTKMKGLPSKRWIWINIPKVLQELHQFVPNE